MGFVKTLIRAGNGVMPKRGQSVTVHCTGYGKNRNMNEKFWSTKDPGQEPFTFNVGLGQVIKGKSMDIPVHGERISLDITIIPFPL